MPGSPEADFHPAGADLPPAARDPGAAPRPARRDTGGQAVPPGRSSAVGKRNGRCWALGSCLKQVFWGQAACWPGCAWFCAPHIQTSIRISTLRWKWHHCKNGIIVVESVISGRPPSFPRVLPAVTWLPAPCHAPGGTRLTQGCSA